MSEHDNSKMELDGIPLNPELHKDDPFIGPHWPRTEIEETSYRSARRCRRYGKNQSFEDMRDDPTKDCDLSCAQCSYCEHRNEYAPCLDRKRRAGLPLVSPAYTFGGSVRPPDTFTEEMFEQHLQNYKTYRAYYLDLFPGDFAAMAQTDDIIRNMEAGGLEWFNKWYAEVLRRRNLGLPPAYPVVPPAHTESAVPPDCP